MRGSLWAALLVVAGASLYVASQGDEAVSGVEPVVRGGADRARTAGPAGAPRQAPGLVAGKTATSRSGPLQAESREMGMQQALVQYVGLWAQRGNAAVAGGPRVVGGAPGAWASQRPPPPPPPPPYLEPPPPPPMAPAFPHKWVGRYVDTAARAVIAGPSQTWVVKAGDVIDGQWRVDTISDRQMQLTYLPLQQSQTVAMK